MLSPRLFPRLFAPLFVLAALLVAPAARAERELIVPFHEGGHLVLDQLSGLRVNPVSGFSYAGPAGISFRTVSSDAFTPAESPTETATTSVWLAPSADVFVTDHLSLGGLVEVGHTWGSVTGRGQSVELPDTTSITLLSRVGFYVPFTDRLGLWPRAGVGWSRVESVSFLSASNTATKESFRSMLLDLDVSLVYRFGETFFMRAGPEVSVTPGGLRTVESGGQRAAAATSVVQFSAVIGFGMNVEL